MSANTIYTAYLLVPIVIVLAILFLTVFYRTKKDKSIVKEIYSVFVKTWENGEVPAEDEEEIFYQTFLRLFKQDYRYNRNQLAENRDKYFLFKALVLVVIAAIPFLMYLLVSKKEFILGKNEWNDIYLYTIIAVPIVFAYLLNRFIIVRRFREMWAHHTKVKQHMEWRMMMLVKDYEMKKQKMTPEEAEQLLDSLKQDFINEICEYWNKSAEEFADQVLSKEENLFQEIGKMLTTK
jgi:hypothetical protein